MKGLPLDRKGKGSLPSEEREEVVNTWKMIEVSGKELRERAHTSLARFQHIKILDAKGSFENDASDS